MPIISIANRLLPCNEGHGHTGVGCQRLDPPHEIHWGSVAGALVVWDARRVA